MHKESFIVNRNKLLHVSTLLVHLQGEFFVIVSLRLHFIVEWECAVDFVLRCFWKRELSLCVCWWLVFLMISVTIIQVCSLALGFGNNSIFVIRLNIMKHILSTVSQKFTFLKGKEELFWWYKYNGIKQMSSKYTKDLNVYKRNRKRYWDGKDTFYKRVS
jgi:hypothetical protein